MKHDIAGDPLRGLKWTRRTTDKIADQLRSLGIDVRPRTVARLLKKMEYSLRVNHKRLSRGSQAGREEQFAYIAEMRERFAARGWPIISVDTKKKEMVGCFRNPGAVWAREPIPVNDHDFRSDALGMAIPYGIYDVQANRGILFIGMSHDTPEFAAEPGSAGFRAECAIPTACASRSATTRRALPSGTRLNTGSSARSARTGLAGRSTAMKPSSGMPGPHEPRQASECVRTWFAGVTLRASRSPRSRWSTSACVDMRSNPIVTTRSPHSEDRLTSKTRSYSCANPYHLNGVVEDDLGLVEAHGINNLGQIVANGVGGHAYRLDRCNPLPVITALEASIPTGVRVAFTAVASGLNGSARSSTGSSSRQCRWNVLPSRIGTGVSD